MRPTTVLADAVRVPRDDEVDRRVLERLRRCRMIGPCHGLRGLAVDALAPSDGALVDHDDLHLHARACAAARTRCWMRAASSRKSEPLGRVGAHELGRRPDRRADHADAHAVDAEDLRRSPSSRGPRPVASSTMFVDRNGKSARSWCGQDALDAEVELVVAEARGVEPPRVLDVDRRPVVEQRRVRRRGADVVAGRQQQRRPGQRAASSSNIVASCAAPPTVDVDVVDRSWSSGRAARGSRSAR